jgi:subtilisin family serine protease
MAKGMTFFTSIKPARLGRALALILLFILGTQGFAEAPKPRFRPDRILVEPKNASSVTKLAALQKRKNHQVLKRFADLGNLQVIQLNAGADPLSEIQAYNASGLVAHAEPDYLLHASLVPNDPAMTNGMLWAMKNIGQSSGKSDADIDATEAWNTINSAESIIVAVIDTGVRVTHEDLAANIWRNSKEVANGLDDDGNGVADDLHGFNSVDGTGNPDDDNGHGTHVAGTIGASANNGKGVAGVAWNVKIMACKFLTNDGGGATSDAIECIDYARKNGAKVINASWGGPDNSYYLERAIKNAGASGIVFVTAAGNELENNDLYPSYPANYKLPNVVSVAATTRNDVLDSSYSNYGATTVHLAAPGSSILSTWNTSDKAYVTLNGTSMATPHVAGAVALLKAYYPTDNVTETVQRLLTGTDKLPSLAGKVISGGRLNLANLFPRSWELSVKTNGHGSVTIDPAGTVFTNNSRVTVTAAAADGYQFTGWSGTVTNSANPLEMALTIDSQLTANFTPLWSLTIPSSDGGDVAITPDKEFYLDGEIVTLTALPADGFAFKSWSVATTTTSTSPQIQIVMNANRVVTANFSHLWKLTVLPTPGGQVLRTPEKDFYVDGEIVTLTALPDANTTFGGWVAGVISGEPMVEVLMNDDLAVTASFASRTPAANTEVKVSSVSLNTGKLTLNVNTVEPVLLEWSTDLETWSRVEDATLNVGETLTQVQLPADSEYRFFRVTSPGQ